MRFGEDSEGGWRPSSKEHKMKRTGKCLHCGWCCERTLFYDYPEEYSAKKAKILAVNKCNTDKRFIKRVSSWIEEHEQIYNRRRVVKIEVGCEYLKWQYNRNKGRRSFCSRYNDKDVGCNFDVRISYPQRVEDLRPDGDCGFKFEKD